MIVSMTGFGDGTGELSGTHYAVEIRSLNNARAARARKGKAADLGFKPASVARVQ